MANTPEIQALIDSANKQVGNINSATSPTNVKLPTLGGGMPSSSAPTQVPTPTSSKSANPSDPNYDPALNYNIPAGPGSPTYSRLNVGTSMSSSTSGGTSQEDLARQATEITPFNEAERRKQLMEAQQANLNAIKAMYDRRVDDERQVGARDMARVNTISALTGMSGSIDATTGQGRSDKRTEDRVAQVNELRQMAVSAVYGKIDENLRHEKELALTNNRENAKAILSKMADNATASLKSIAEQGISWDKFKEQDPEALQTLIRQTGLSEYALRSQYNDSMPAEYKPVSHVDYKDNGDGSTTMMRVLFDPLTKKTTTENYKIAAPISMFKAGEKPIEVGGKLLVKQADGSYKDVAPHTEEEIEADRLKNELTRSQIDQNYASAASSRATAATKITPGAIGMDYVAGKDPIVDAWVNRINAGSAKLSDLTGDKNLKNKVMVGLNTVSGGKLGAVQQNISEAEKLVQELIDHPGRSSVTGAPNMITNPFGKSLPNSNARDFKTKVDRLNALLFLNAVPQMKGMGQLTEREGAKLESSASTIGQYGVKEDVYLKELQRLQTNLKESYQNIGGEADSRQPITTATGQYAPGSIVEVNGVQYTVGDDGDTLIEQ